MKSRFGCFAMNPIYCDSTAGLAWRHSSLALLTGDKENLWKLVEVGVAKFCARSVADLLWWIVNEVAVSPTGGVRRYRSLQCKGSASKEMQNIADGFHHTADYLCDVCFSLQGESEVDVETHELLHSNVSG